VSLEKHFDAVFATVLALREKQIQQNYRPIIGVHKWFARRPGTIFRNLLLAEFNGSEPLETNYWRAHEFHGVIADPFMGGGTPIYEANRLGFSVVGTDINPMAFWVVRQSLSELDLKAFQSAAESVTADVERVIGSLYRTKCLECGNPAEVKYFLWVKTEICPHCNTTHDLFPGYLLAEAERHPRHVSFRHFVEKYLRAKNYCVAPFETEFRGKQKRIVAISGERIGGDLVTKFPGSDKRQAWIQAAPAERAKLPASSLDGVFTDPPYFDNVQYAELMDFCFAWLRLGLKDEFREFTRSTTRNGQELTGNTTLGRGLEHFTGGLSQVFCHYAAALKRGAPFVFTYHHNNPEVYLPLVVAILDAGMTCTVTLPVAAEMNASLHIAGTVSSSLDSVFVCRKEGANPITGDIRSLLDRDLTLMRQAGVKLRDGDVRCLAAGDIARRAVQRLHATWDGALPLQKRMVIASACLRDIIAETDVESLVTELQPAAKWQQAAKEPTIAATI
jgi:adenine-specific DNA methylase